MTNRPEYPSRGGSYRRENGKLVKNWDTKSEPKPAPAPKSNPFHSRKREEK